MSQLSKPSIDLGLNFLKKVGSASDSTNLLLSPLSVIIAYGMALEGAVGETAKQIRKVLNLDKVDSQQDVSKIMKQLMEKYLKNKDSTLEKQSLMLLEFGNLLMANKDFRLQKNYVQNLQTNYSANAFNEDFNDGQKILEKVNSWVSEATRNKISTILNEPPQPDAEVTEAGTVATAATHVKFMLGCSLYSPQQQKVFNFIADRPFLFFIRDNRTKVNLFMGQLNNITSQQIMQIQHNE